MSMHMVGPWLTTTGKKKGKKKWSSADAKRRAETAKAEREKTLKEFNVKPSKRPRRRDDYVWTEPVKNDFNPRYQPNAAVSTNREHAWAPCTKTETLFYTGTRLKGIAIMHKSNLVPIFNNEEAIEIAKMRR